MFFHPLWSTVEFCSLIPPFLYDETLLRLLRTTNKIIFFSITKNSLPTLLSRVSGKDPMKIHSDHSKSCIPK